MTKYNSVIYSLLKKEKKEGKNPHVYFLTVYFPCPNEPLQKLKNELFVVIREALHSKKILKNEEWLKESLSKKLEKKIYSLKGPLKGVAVFLKIDNKLRTLEATVLSLPQEPQPETLLNKVFDLDQLVWLSHIAVPAVILHITRKKASLYTLSQGTLSKIIEQENRLIEQEQREYSNRYPVPSLSKAPAFSSDLDNIKKHQKQQDRRFLESMGSVLMKDPRLESGLNYLVLFYSSNFNDFIKGFEKKIKKRFPEVFLIPINKTFCEEKSLEKEALKNIKQHQEKIGNKLLKNAKESFPLFVEGWPGVAKSARRKKIEILFINPEIKKAGFINKKGLPFTKFIRGSRKTKNLTPWIVKTVLESKGKIVVLSPKNKEEKVPEIAAKLRF